jgi:hypothetical protein
MYVNPTGVLDLDNLDDVFKVTK